MNQEEARKVETIEARNSASGKDASSLDHELDPSALAIQHRIMYVVESLHTAPCSTNANFNNFRRKTDQRLIPLVVLLYAISLIDRTNLAGARISGIDAELGLDQGNRYSVVRK